MRGISAQQPYFHFHAKCLEFLDEAIALNAPSHLSSDENRKPLEAINIQCNKTAALAAPTWVGTYKNLCRCSKIPTLLKYCCTYKKIFLHLQNVGAGRFCKQAKSCCTYILQVQEDSHCIKILLHLQKKRHLQIPSSTYKIL